MSWFSRRRPKGAGRANPYTTAAVVIAVGLLAVGIAWTLQEQLQQWTTRWIATRAVARIETVLLADIAVGGFEAPRPGQESALTDRLDALLERARTTRTAGILEANIYALDGTVLFSPDPNRVGRKILASRVPRLAGALAGTVNTRLLALSSADDADLTNQYTEVLAVYAPIRRDERVVAATEIYVDPLPIRIARIATWVGIIGPVTLGLLLYVRGRLAEQEDQLERLTREAFFDSLTGLANRALFLFRLNQAFYRAERRGEMLVVMFLDLDRFKQINDTYGHAAGDQLLQAVGNRLQSSVRPEDTIARLGGDEFTVLLESVPSLRDATAIADRILAAMRAPFFLADQERSVRVSIGIAARTADHGQPDDVLKDADAALYQAKAAGKDRYAVFRAEGSPPRARAS